MHVVISRRTEGFECTNGGDDRRSHSSDIISTTPTAYGIDSAKSVGCLKENRIDSP